MTDRSNLIVGQLEACSRWGGEMGPYGWQSGYGAVGKWVLEAIGRDDADQLHEASEALRDAIAAAPEDFHDERVGWLSGLLGLIRVYGDGSPLQHRTALDRILALCQKPLDERNTQGPTRITVLLEVEDVARNALEGRHG